MTPADRSHLLPFLLKNSFPNINVAFAWFVTFSNTLASSKYSRSVLGGNGKLRPLWRRCPSLSRRRQSTGGQ